jgi:hypothetical protein
LKSPIAVTSIFLSFFESESIFARKILAVKAGRGNPAHATIVRIIQYLEEQKNDAA